MIDPVSIIFSSKDNTTLSTILFCLARTFFNKSAAKSYFDHFKVTLSIFPVSLFFLFLSTSIVFSSEGRPVSTLKRISFSSILPTRVTELINGIIEYDRWFEVGLGSSTICLTNGFSIFSNPRYTKWRISLLEISEASPTCPIDNSSRYLSGASKRSFKAHLRKI